MRCRAETHPEKLDQKRRTVTGHCAKAGHAKKWFQVTRWIARSPTGMHGLNLASGSDVT
jgi:hypothetical protein